MNDAIKVGFCVAYDWYFLENSIPLIYDDADSITISFDKDQISWNHQKYEMDILQFEKLISRLDIHKKIKVVQEDYHLQELSPGANEVRQRNLLAQHMGKGGWHLQIDCDEYMVDFANFVKYLRSIPMSKKDTFNVCCPMITLYKKLDEGILFISNGGDDDIEYFNIATRNPTYEYGRRNGHFNIYTNFIILHQSWAREAAEVRNKIENWGHAKDLDINKYFQFWSDLSVTNYQEARNIHPVKPEIWKRLKLAKGGSINELLPYFRGLDEFKRSKVALAFKNNKNVSRIKALFALLTRK